MPRYFELQEGQAIHSIDCDLSSTIGWVSHSLNTPIVRVEGLTIRISSHLKWAAECTAGAGELAALIPKSVVVVEDRLKIESWFVNPYDTL